MQVARSSEIPPQRSSCPAAFEPLPRAERALITNERGAPTTRCCVVGTGRPPSRTLMPSSKARRAIASQLPRVAPRHCQPRRDPIASSRGRRRHPVRRPSKLCASRSRRRARVNGRNPERPLTGRDALGRRCRGRPLAALGVAAEPAVSDAASGWSWPGSFQPSRRLGRVDGRGLKPGRA